MPDERRRYLANLHPSHSSLAHPEPFESTRLPHRHDGRQLLQNPLVHVAGSRIGFAPRLDRRTPLERTPSVVRASYSPHSPQGSSERAAGRCVGSAVAWMCGRLWTGVGGVGWGGVVLSWWWIGGLLVVAVRNHGTGADYDDSSGLSKWTPGRLPRPVHSRRPRPRPVSADCPSASPRDSDSLVRTLAWGRWVLAGRGVDYDRSLPDGSGGSRSLWPSRPWTPSMRGSWDVRSFQGSVVVCGLVVSDSVWVEKAGILLAHYNQTMDYYSL